MQAIGWSCPGLVPQLHSFTGHWYEKDFDSRDAFAVSNETRIDSTGETAERHANDEAIDGSAATHEDGV
jgi:hypothetical protein